MLCVMLRLAALVLGLSFALLVARADAALPPEAYAEARQSAAFAFMGTVLTDPGGRASVRVEHVARGALSPGQVVTVLYPPDTGALGPPGAQVAYRAFAPSTRVRVFAHPGYDATSVQIVDGGIDIVSSTPPSRGGCAACAVAGNERQRGGSVGWLVLGAVGGCLLWRRRGLGWAGLWAALLLAACTAPAATGPQPTPRPTATAPDGPEVTTDGKSTVTVLSRPDHPAVKPPPGAAGAAPTTADCRAREACPAEGRCTSNGTSCVAASYGDCAQMRSCASGRCAFEAGVSGASGVCKVVASCQASQRCQSEGLCDEGKDRCVASPDGCSQSQRCHEEGRCAVDEGVCVAAADADCKSASLCAAEGRCKADAGRCVAPSDQHCKATAACKDEGRCLARDGVCVKSCQDSELCTRHGRCGERASQAGSCVATSDAACDASLLCKELGHCSLGLDGRCEAGDDVECRLSQTCKEDGRCTHKAGRCAPASNAECEASTIACHREGRCKHHDGRCVKG